MLLPSRVQPAGRHDSPLLFMLQVIDDLVFKFLSGCIGFDVIAWSVIIGEIFADICDLHRSASTDFIGPGVDRFAADPMTVAVVLPPFVGTMDIDDHFRPIVIADCFLRRNEPKLYRAAQQILPGQALPEPPAINTFLSFRNGAISSKIATRFQKALPIKQMSYRCSGPQRRGLNMSAFTASGK